MLKITVIYNNINDGHVANVRLENESGNFEGMHREGRVLGKHLVSVNQFLKLPHMYEFRFSPAAADYIAREVNLNYQGKREIPWAKE